MTQNILTNASTLTRPLVTARPVGGHAYSDIETGTAFYSDGRGGFYAPRPRRGRPIRVPNMSGWAKNMAEIDRRRHADA